jgi:hypothetical protein
LCSEPADQVDAIGGLIFWATDADNFYIATYDEKGNFRVNQRTSGQWQSQTEACNAVKPGDSNVLEIRTDHGTATFFFNGKPVLKNGQQFTRTGQPPSRGSEIGLFAQSGSDRTSVWRFANMVVMVPGKNAPLQAAAVPEIHGLWPPMPYADGKVSLESANIGGDLSIRGVQFAQKGWLDATDATVKGTLFLQGLKLDPQARISLIDTSVGPLYDDDSWPQPTKVSLDGFTYSRFDTSADACKRLLIWLGRPCPPNLALFQTFQRQTFQPQPYEQLAKVLREAGDEPGETQVLMQMESDRRRSLSWAGRMITGPILHYSVGYGYRPRWGVYWSLCFILVGWWRFAKGYNEGAIAPYHPLSYEISKRNREGSRKDDDGTADTSRHKRPSVPDYDPPFSPLWYSLDNFLPLVDLRQKDRWMPDLHCDAECFTWFKHLGEKAFAKIDLSGRWKWGERFVSRWHESAKWKRGWWLRLYVWFLTLIGWLLSSLILAALTGIIHQ